MAAIVICAAQSVTRAGLAAMAVTATAEVVGQVGSVRSLSHWLQTQRADLAIIEITAAETEILETVLNIVETPLEEERLSVLLLVEGEMDALAHSGLSQLISTGAVSMVPMGVSASGLRSAIAAIFSGFTVLHPDLTETLFSPTEPTFNSLDMELEPLTPREVEVLNRLADGLTNRAIARALNISEHTVKFHISAILSKLSASSRTEAVAVGIRTGLVML
ncbi:MAG: response regulator transcription factor [Cyanobacteria bacterium J06560_2]